MPVECATGVARRKDPSSVCFDASHLFRTLSATKHISAPSSFLSEKCRKVQLSSKPSHATPFCKTIVASTVDWVRRECMLTPAALLQELLAPRLMPEQCRKSFRWRTSAVSPCHRQRHCNHLQLLICFVCCFPRRMRRGSRPAPPVTKSIGQLAMKVYHCNQIFAGYKQVSVCPLSAPPVLPGAKIPPPPALTHRTWFALCQLLSTLPPQASKREMS